MPEFKNSASWIPSLALGLTAAVMATLLSAVLIVALVIGRTPYFTWASRFVLAIWLVAFAVQYRSLPYRKAGLKRPPPFFNLLWLHAIIQSLFWCAFWIALFVLIDRASVQTFRAAVFAGLVTGATSYRRRRWEITKEGWSFHVAAGIAAAVLSVPIGELLVNRLLR